MAIVPARFWQWVRNATREDLPVLPMLRKHFGRIKPSDLTIAERQFPFRVRADLQRALEQVLAAEDGAPTDRSRVRVLSFCGVRQEHAFEGIDFAGMLSDAAGTAAIATPPQYEEVDIGEEQPVRTLNTGLWLLEHDGQR